MNFRIIHRLASALPDRLADRPIDPAYLQSPELDGGTLLDGTKAAPSEPKPEVFQEKVSLDFLMGYSSLDFGWRAAVAFAKANRPLPFVPSGKDSWVYKAWKATADPDTFKGHPAVDVMQQAWEIRHSIAGRSTKQVLEAALISREGTDIPKLAFRLGLPKQLIEAYEVLHFNVHDRWADHVFLRNLVYPHSRFEEMLKGYLSKGNIEAILRRMGYDKGLDSVLYFAGFRNGYGEELSMEEAANLFQQHLMVQGYILGANGLLTHSQHYPVVNAARQFLQTKNLGGQEVGNNYQFDNLGGSIRDALNRDSQFVQDNLKVPVLS